MYDELRKYARHGRRCILFGPSGSGKEHAARFFFEEYQKCSDRKLVFHSINCAGLTAGTAHSELFGHVQGAFTGAHRNRAGLFRSARGGVLFLDEIGDLPTDIVPIFLRALDPVHGSACQLGSDEPYSTTDITIICATEQSATAMRPALLARLGKQVSIPGLDDRPEDMEPAVSFFAARALMKCRDKEELIQRYSGMTGDVKGEQPAVSQATRDLLNDSSETLVHLVQCICRELTPRAMSRAWPANFRALSTAVDSAIVCADRHDTLDRFIAGITEQFEEHAPRYSCDRDDSPAAVSRAPECEAEDGKVEALRRQLLSVLPGGADREVEALRMAQFLAAWTDRPFRRCDLQKALPEMKDRTLQNRLTVLLSEQIIERLSESGHRYLYAPDSLMFKTSRELLKPLDFPSSVNGRFKHLDIPSSVDTSRWRGDPRLEEMCRRVQLTGRVFLEGGKPSLRTALALSIADQADTPFRVSYMECIGFQTLEHLVDAVEKQFILPDILAAAQTCQRSLQERIAYCSGFVFTRCENRHVLLIVDGTEHLTSGEDREHLAEMIRAWSWLTFILCGVKMPNELANLCHVLDAGLIDAP